MRVSMDIVNKAVILNLVEEQGNEVRVILGGNDGILVTIDANGHIGVRGPEGPGDPEVRAAVTAILEGAAVLSRIAAAGARG